MRFDENHESDDVIDRRGEGGARGPSAAGILPFLPMLMRSRFGWVIIVAFVGYSALKGIGLGKQEAAQGQHGAAKPDTELVHFVSFVLDDTQGYWTTEMRGQNV